MKLGQKVKFNKYFKKRDRYDERMDRIKYKTLKVDEPLEGYVSGKRTIPYKGYSDQELGYHYFVPKEYKNVILVACNWSGFYRVPEEWLQEVEDEKD